MARLLSYMNMPFLYTGLYTKPPYVRVGNLFSLFGV